MIERHVKAFYRVPASQCPFKENTASWYLIQVRNLDSGSVRMKPRCPCIFGTVKGMGQYFKDSGPWTGSVSKPETLGLGTIPRSLEPGPQRLRL